MGCIGSKQNLARQISENEHNLQKAERQCNYIQTRIGEVKLQLRKKDLSNIKLAVIVDNVELEGGLDGFRRTLEPRFNEIEKKLTSLTDDHTKSFGTHYHKSHGHIGRRSRRKTHSPLKRSIVN